uniref:Ig-like domain-containing protein n=1 Tax=Leptobrachium leishanense TaxID=445787 RepID=A0A8C5QD95_9ANUR
MALYQYILNWLWLLSLIAGRVAPLKQVVGAAGASVYLFADVPALENQDIEWSITSWIARLTTGSSPNYQGRCAGRCEVFQNGTLRMDRLVAADAVAYDVAYKEIGVTVIHKLLLTVHNLLTVPTLSLSVTIRPLNGSNIDLQCIIGSQLVSSYFFYRDEQLVTCQPPHLSCNETSPFLYFRPVTEHDTGNYTCVIQNAVSRNSSAPLSLNVAVSVSQVTLSNNASSPVLAEKESVALTCSSLGTDLSYSWQLDGAALPKNARYLLTGSNSTLVISPVTRNDQGVFTCIVANYLNNETSNPLTLSWSPEGQLKCGIEHLGESVELSCWWPGGYPAADLQLLFHVWSPTGQNQVSQMLPIGHVFLGTVLSCTGSHWGRNEACSLSIDTPQSEGFINNSVFESPKGGSILVTLPLTSGRSALSNYLQATSLATNILPGIFVWYRFIPEPVQLFHGGNIGIISRDYESLLAVHSMTEDLVGNYMCSVENLMGTTYFTFALDMTSENGSIGLSPGALAGIVIGIVAVCALIIIILILYKKKRTTQRGVSQNSPERPTITLVNNPTLNGGVSQNSPERPPITLVNNPSLNGEVDEHTGKHHKDNNDQQHNGGGNAYSAEPGTETRENNPPPNGGEDQNAIESRNERPLPNHQTAGGEGQNSGDPAYEILLANRQSAATIIVRMISPSGEDQNSRESHTDNKRNNPPSNARVSRSNITPNDANRAVRFVTAAAEHPGTQEGVERIYEEPDVFASGSTSVFTTDSTPGPPMPTRAAPKIPAPANPPVPGRQAPANPSGQQCQPNQ